MDASHFTPAGIAKLQAVGRAVLQRPDVVARRAQVIAEKASWPEETQAAVRQWAADGVPVNEIGRRLGLHFDTVKARARRHGIDLRGPARERYARAAALLRKHYQTEMPLGELLTLYREALAQNVTPDAMQAYARKLGLSRPRDKARKLGNATRAARAHQERLALAPQVQALLDQHVPLEAITPALGVSHQRLQRMLREGSVTRPPKPPKAPPPPKVRQAKPPKAPPPPKPKVLPKSWVRVEAPQKPRPTYESVEAWLAAGNRITRCPAAVAVPTTHTPSADDAAAMRDYYAARAAAESGTWKQRAKKKMGRMHFGAGAG